MQPIPASINVAARYRQLLIIWSAILISVGILFGLTLFMPRQMMEENKILQIILGAFGGFVAVFSFVSKQKMLERAAGQQQPRLVNTAYIMAFILSETVGIFGLSMYLLTPGRSYYALFILSALLMLAHFPRREHLLAASFKHQ